MTPDRLREIAELYHTARESDPTRRAELLARADPELRRHVESLLARPDESLPDPDARTATVMQPGARFGPYQVESKLGAGGMGDVFRAIDTRLGRAVAIKTTREEFGARFEREGRAISSLNHPNICALYDVGPNYLVMELVEGETIAARLQRGRLPVETAISYASQIVAALVEAHGKGIVHRDLKPANIMIAKTGIKVLDFGLAKSSQDETLTASRMILGTPAYMAPEQREGKPADARSDLYSFGCVFYEMLSGSRPASQRKRLPSRRLETIVARCLEEDPERRWQSAAELGRELERATAAVPARPAILAACAVTALLGVAIFAWSHRPTPTAVHSLAILGLENRSGDVSQDYFANGLTNSLSAGLARLNGLRVIPAGATQAYRGMQKPLPEIGKELNAEVLLAGAVSQTGNRVQIRIRLVNAASGRDRWSHTYESAEADLPASQNQMERDIAAQLQASAPDRARMIDTRKLDPRAYDLYLRGSYHTGLFTPQDTDEAIGLFEQAVVIAPDFAPLQADLASAYATKSFSYAPDDREAEERAFAAIQKAFALDPDSAEAHLARGRLLWRQSHNFPHRAALAEFRLAAAARPNLGSAWSEIASVLIHVGHLDESLVELRKAEALNPGETSASGRVSEVYLFQGKPELSLDERNQTQNASRAPIVEFNRVWALVDLARFAEAARHIRTGFTDSKSGAAGLKHAVSALLAARQADRQTAEAEIRATLAEPQGYGQFHHIAFMIACAYSALGDVERAQEWIEKSASAGFPCFTLFEVEPSLERWRATAKGRDFLANLRREWAPAL